MNSPGKIHGDQQCAKVEEGIREQPKCAECGAHKGHGMIGRGAPCSQMPMPEILEHLKLYYESLRKVSDNFHNQMIRKQQNAVMWHGKYMLVKHENNQLRKKVQLTTQSTRIRELEAKVESLNGHEVMREYERLFKAHPFYYKAEHTPLVNDCVALAWTAVRNILERATTTQKG